MGVSQVGLTRHSLARTESGPDSIFVILGITDSMIRWLISMLIQGPIHLVWKPVHLTVTHPNCICSLHSQPIQECSMLNHLDVVNHIQRYLKSAQLQVLHVKQLLSRSERSFRCHLDLIGYFDKRLGPISRWQTANQWLFPVCWRDPSNMVAYVCLLDKTM